MLEESAPLPPMGTGRFLIFEYELQQRIGLAQPCADIPDRVQVGLTAKPAHPHIIAAAVYAIAGMKRLMDITDDVDD